MQTCSCGTGRPERQRGSVCKRGRSAGWERLRVDCLLAVCLCLSGTLIDGGETSQDAVMSVRHNEAEVGQIHSPHT
eukprot:7132853-Prymnesium_polylepis.2